MIYARKNLLTLRREGACSARGSARLRVFLGGRGGRGTFRSTGGIADALRLPPRRPAHAHREPSWARPGLGALADIDAAGKDKGKSKRRGSGKRKSRKDKRGVRAQAASCCSGGDCTPGAGKNLGKCCYEGQNLAGKNFKSANLGNANFSGATLTNANFTSANLDKTCFVDADVTGAKFNGANTASAIFCRTQTSQGINNSGCRQGERLLPDLRRHWRWWLRARRSMLRRRGMHRERRWGLHLPAGCARHLRWRVRRPQHRRNELRRVRRGLPGRAKPAKVVSAVVAMPRAVGTG